MIRTLEKKNLIYQKNIDNCLHILKTDVYKIKLNAQYKVVGHCMVQSVKKQTYIYIQTDE
jgi:hypothetical protein